MIRINLARDRTLQVRRPTIEPEVTRLGLILTLIFVADFLLLAWWWWSLNRELAEKTRRRDALEREYLRLQQLESKVKQYEKQKRELEARIAVIEKLKENQTGPVELLRNVASSVPDELWLTSLNQKGSTILIDGYFLRDEALPRFIANLQATRFFRSVDLNFFEREKGVEAARFSLKCEVVRKHANNP